MNKIKMMVIGLLIVGSIGCAYARTSAEELEGEYKDPSKNPLGCRNVGYQYTFNVLKLAHEMNAEDVGDGQSLFFVYNRRSEPVHLNQMLSDNSTRSTYLNHVIAPKQWAVLATNQNELKYICSLNAGKLGYGKIVSCADSLKVCEYVRVKFGMNNKGNYWVVKSANRGVAVGDVVRYGIIPR